MFLPNCCRDVGSGTDECSRMIVQMMYNVLCLNISTYAGTSCTGTLVKCKKTVEECSNDSIAHTYKTCTEHTMTLYEELTPSVRVFIVTSFFSIMLCDY